MPKITIPSIFNQAEIARKMWPGNSDAESYLVRKINEKDGRRLTYADKEKIAEIVLNEAKEFSENILK